MYNHCMSSPGNVQHYPVYNVFLAMFNIIQYTMCFWQCSTLSSIQCVSGNVQHYPVYNVFLAMFNIIQYTMCFWQCSTLSSIQCVSGNVQHYPVYNVFLAMFNIIQYTMCFWQCSTLSSIQCVSADIAWSGLTGMTTTLFICCSPHCPPLCLSLRPHPHCGECNGGDGGGGRWEEGGPRI